MKQYTLDNYKLRILRVLAHIQRDIDEAKPLKELAAIAAFSPYHFHRVFRGVVGTTVKEYIKHLRMERAAMQLQHSAIPISRIALNAGYKSHQAFSRAFKVSYGMSPKEFREEGYTCRPTVHTEQSMPIKIDE